jgi:hypothetical protein
MGLIIKRFAVLSLFLVIFSSCFVGNHLVSKLKEIPGFYSGYHRLDEADNAKIVFTKDEEIPSDTFMYAITAKQIRKLCSKYPRVVLYFWDAHCSAGECIPIPTFTKYCADNGYNGIVIAEYYAFEKLEEQGVKPCNIYAINHKYYKTDYCNWYLKRFQNDLLELYQHPKLSGYPQKFMYIENNEINFSGFKNMLAKPYPILQH